MRISHYHINQFLSETQRHCSVRPVQKIGHFRNFFTIIYSTRSPYL